MICFAGRLVLQCYTRSDISPSVSVFSMMFAVCRDESMMNPFFQPHITRRLFDKLPISCIAYKCLELIQHLMTCSTYQPLVLLLLHVLLPKLAEKSVVIYVTFFSQVVGISLPRNCNSQSVTSLTLPMVTVQFTAQWESTRSKSKNRCSPSQDWFHLIGNLTPSWVSFHFCIHHSKTRSRRFINIPRTVASLLILVVISSNFGLRSSSFEYFFHIFDVGKMISIDGNMMIVIKSHPSFPISSLSLLYVVQLLLRPRLGQRSPTPKHTPTISRHLG